MKKEEEIRAEIEATNRTIANYRNSYSNSEISKVALHNKLIDCESTIGALRWVLGENDRYD